MGHETDSSVSHHTLSGDGILQTEIAGHWHKVAWKNLLGIDTARERPRARAVVALRVGSLDRTAAAVKPSRLGRGAPGTGDRSWPEPLRPSSPESTVSPASCTGGAAVRSVKVPNPLTWVRELSQYTAPRSHTPRNPWANAPIGV